MDLEQDQVSPPAPSGLSEQGGRGLDNQAYTQDRAGKRRRYTKAYKQRIVAEADANTQQGGVGAILRREGLYSSNLSRFRVQLETGLPEDRSPELKQRETHERTMERQRERRELQRLQKENQRLRDIIELQKKIGELLGRSMEEEESPPRTERK